MRSLFRSKHRITQEYGVNKDYYSKFGLQGHEGLDLVPTGTDWTVKALADGVVVKDEDNPRSGAYGVYVTLWHPSLKKATQYCHLASNSVSLGQNVKEGETIGVMGSTGNSTGAHVHLNLFQTDDSGVRLNRDNGFLGGINPLPFIEEGVMVEVDSKTFEQLVDKSTKYDALLPEHERVSKLLHDNEETNKQKDVIIEDLRQEAVRLRNEIAELQSANTTNLSKIADLTSAMEKDAVHDRDLETKNYELEKQITELNNEITKLKEEKAKPAEEAREEVIGEWQPIMEEFFKNLIKGKKAQSLREKFWKWVR